MAKTNHVMSLDAYRFGQKNKLTCSYVQPRAYFEEEDHRFDKLPMVGEGTWDDSAEEEGDVAPEVDVPMTQIVRN